MQFVGLRIRPRYRRIPHAIALYRFHRRLGLSRLIAVRNAYWLLTF